MKTRLPRGEFADALDAVSAVAPSRSPKPIFECVCVETEGTSVSLATTNGEVSARVTVEAYRVERPGAVVVPAERLLAVVRDMPDEEISLEAAEEHCLIRGEGREYRLFGRSRQDFPAVPDFAEGADLQVEAQWLQRMVALTLYAAAREMSRYAINGVLWEKKGRRLCLVATDGRRLARAGGTLLEAGGPDFQVIVPSKALTVFERVFPGSPEGGSPVVQVRIEEGRQLVLRSGERVLSTALVEGTFPKYQDVIPTEAKRRATLHRGNFYGAVRRAAIVTGPEGPTVKLAFAKNRLVLTSQGAETGEAREEMAVDFEGEPIEISFNAIYLQDVLKALTQDEVKLELTEGYRPSVLLGGDREEFLYVVMPVAT